MMLVVGRLILSVILLMGAPTDVRAGLFSIHYTAQKDTASSVSNIQTMPLLANAHNPKAKDLAEGGGDITIVDSSALLPEAGPAGTAANIEPSRGSGHISVYVVREGDTLSQVANMFGVSTNTIVWANDIEHGSHITPGQTLVILPISGVQHTVAKGDTLKSIAEKYDGNLEEILDYNNLGAHSAIAVGDVITIPDGEIASSKAVTKTYSSPSTGSTAVASGYYRRPIDGGVKSQGIHGYNGVDLATYAGAPIYAAADGEVIISREGGWNGGYGSYVVIRHGNGTQTLYAHNTSNAVSVGQYVVQGQVVGYVGSTGKSTGNHVHFEVRGAHNPF